MTVFIIFCSLFISSCDYHNCESFTTFENDVTLLLNITDASTGDPIGDHLANETIRLMTGLSAPQLLKKEWTDISVGQAEFSVNLTPGCGLPTSKSYTLVVGSLGSIKGTIFYDLHFEKEKCNNICTGKFISRIDFDGTDSLEYEYNDNNIRVLNISI